MCVCSCVTAFDDQNGFPFVSVHVLRVYMCVCRAELACVCIEGAQVCACVSVYLCVCFCVYLFVRLSVLVSVLDHLDIHLNRQKRAEPHASESQIQLH